MHWSAGTTPASSATPTHTSTDSGANSGTAVTALTGVKATGSDTFLKTINGGSGYLEAYDAQTSGTKQVADGTRIPFITSASHTAASLGSPSTSNAAPDGHKHSYSQTTGVTLTANESEGTGRITYVQAISGGSGSLSSNSESSGGIYYLNSHTAASLGGTTTFVTGYPNFSGGGALYFDDDPHRTEISNYVSMVTYVTPSSLTGTTTFLTGASGTFVTGITAGSLTANALPQVGDIGFFDATGSTSAVTGVNGGSGSFYGSRSTAGSNYAYRRYLQLNHSHTAASASGTTTVPTGSTKYLHYTSASASGTGSVSTSSGSFTFTEGEFTRTFIRK